MVGAGFSLNAEALPGVEACFSTWRDLARRMFEEIYPLSSSASESERAKWGERFHTKGPLRLASEYREVFGDQRLFDLVRKEIPDGGYRPGRVHKMLLELPWVDVFTTNYDTLLERTEIFSRSYQVVARTEDLVARRSPRIVKLHGSFPSQTPFILTEEDYRTYPAKFAPFVNLVQQSLLENSFVLLGFSGDDPNFLQWTGWVRDELGPRHAPIYLVGLLYLNPAEYGLLTTRGVTPIDLAPVAEKIGKCGNIHEECLEWFLRSLAAAKPAAPELWPTIRRGLTADAYLESYKGPSLADSSDAPIPSLEFISPTHPQKESDVIAVLEPWRYERIEYSGWVVAPPEVRWKIWTTTKWWVPNLIHTVRGWSALERAVAFRELVWRLDLALVPLFQEWREPLMSTLEAGVNSLLEELDMSRERRFSFSQEDLFEAMSEIALMLCGEFREDYDATRWQRMMEVLDKLTKGSTLYDDARIHEKAIWYLWNVERDEAMREIKKWQPRDLLSGIRKAGLLAELGELREAQTLLRTTLNEIRRSAVGNLLNLQLLSLEGWALYSLGLVEGALGHSYGREQYTGRLYELKAYQCDPSSQIDYFNAALNTNYIRDNAGLRKDYAFESGKHSLSWSPERIFEDYFPGYSCLRMIDKVGIPRGIGTDPTGTLLGRACERISHSNDCWSPAILLRAGQWDEFKKHRFLSRSRVSKMESGIAKRIYGWCFSSLKSELEAGLGGRTFDLKRGPVIKALVETLSRLTLKLDDVELHQSFELVLSFLPRASQHKYLFSAWLHRILDAAEGTILTDFVLRILDEVFDLIEPSILRQPISRLKRDSLSDVQHEKLQGVVQGLIHTHPEGTTQNAKQARRILLLLCHAGLLSFEHNERLKDILWNSLSEPEIPVLYDYNKGELFYLPSPSHIDLSEQVKNSLILALQGDTKDNVVQSLSLMDDIASASLAVVPMLGEGSKGISWSSDDARTFLTFFENCWKQVKKLLPAHAVPLMAITRHDDYARGFSRFLNRTILPFLAVSTDGSESKYLRDTFEEAKLHRINLQVSLPYAIISGIVGAHDVEKELLEAFDSNDEEEIRASAEALRHWRLLATHQKVPHPPSLLLDRLIRKVSFREGKALSSCIRSLSHLLLQDMSVVSVEEVGHLSQSLSAWAGVFTRDHVGTAPDEDLVPELMRELGGLAVTLGIWLERSDSGNVEKEGIEVWESLCIQSSLPEVRRIMDETRELLARHEFELSGRERDR